jgi:hypothetical protein
MTSPYTLIDPTSGARISQVFGSQALDYAPYRGHMGVDYSVVVGTPIRAAHDGKVLVGYNETGYGVYVRLIGDGYDTVYGHLSHAWSQLDNQSVQRGQVLGLSGNTGWSTAPHLHFGLRPYPISYDNGYGGYINPLPYIVDWKNIPMPSKLSFQAQKPDYPQWYIDHVLYSGVKMHKVMDPRGPANPFPGVEALARFTFGGADEALVSQGRAGAVRYVEMLLGRLNEAPWVRAVELPNEPAIPDLESCRRLAEFTHEACRLLVVRGFKPGALVLSTGNPAGPPENPLPTIREKWRLLGPALEQAAYYVKHEYGMRRMAPPDGWHLLAYRRDVQYLREFGYRVPPILITETGIDYDANPNLAGWAAQGITEDEYLGQLRWYDTELQKDPEVLMATPFIWLDYNWPSFSIPESLSRKIAAYIHDSGAPNAPPEGPTMPETNNPNLPENLPPQPLQTAIEKVRWFLEEEQRQRQAGNSAWANEMHDSLIRLLYRIESAMKSV